MTKAKRYSVLTLLVVIVLGVTAFGHTQELRGDITFWHSFTQGERLEWIQQAADDFTALHPGVTITIETFPWGDFYTKWVTGLASGNVPDLSTALPGHVLEMIDAEALIPLNDLIDEIGRDRFYAPAIAEGTMNGNNYSVPLYSHAQVMWYRTDLLEQAGLDVPETWDELYEAAKALTGNGIYGASFPAGSGDMMATRYLNFYVRSGGGSLLTEDLKANLTSDLAIEGIKYWVKVYEAASPKDSINYNVNDQANLFYLGKTAFDFNSAFHISGVERNSPELMDYIACAPLPKINKEDPHRGVETSNIPMVIWKNSKHPAIAKEFVEFMYQDERYVEFLHSIPVGMLPSLAGIIDNPAYLANETVQKFSDAVRIISEAVSRGTAIGFDEHGPSVQAGYLTSQGIIEAMFQDIIVNGVDVEVAARNAERELNDLFSTLQ
ncbi:MAG: ABC transporter substrate-binding protein [Limnochordia bacterium]|jgi:multiple sugar transport system substrate-binding protein